MRRAWRLPRRVSLALRPPADDRFLGIEGQYFVQKVAVTQTLTVLLQAPSKLPVMARAAMMQGATSPVLWLYDALLVPLYWLFLAALVANALYPSVLLRSKSARVQRDAAAGFDAALDLTYFLTFSLSRDGPVQ